METEEDWEKKETEEGEDKDIINHNNNIAFGNAEPISDDDL